MSNVRPLFVFVTIMFSCSCFLAVNTNQDVTMHRERLHDIVKIENDEHFALALGKYLHEFYGVDDSVGFGNWRVVLDGAMLSVGNGNDLVLKNKDGSIVKTANQKFFFLTNGIWEFEMPSDLPDATVVVCKTHFLLIYSENAVIKRIAKKNEVPNR
jgi:hypothetical protein